MPQNKLHISVFLSSPSDLKEERDIAQQIGKELNRMYASQGAVHVAQAISLRPESEKMADAFSLGIEAASKAVAIAVQMTPQKKSELGKLFQTFYGIATSMDGFRGSLSGMKDSMMAIPRFSNQFNRARRNLRQTVDHLDSRLEMLGSQVRSFLDLIKEQKDKATEE